jgi:hypothetical protein
MTGRPSWGLLRGNHQFCKPHWYFWQQPSENIILLALAKQIVTASRDSTARVYLTRIEDLMALARTRVTRELTCEERQKYLHENITCPTLTPAPTWTPLPTQALTPEP